MFDAVLVVCGLHRFSSFIVGVLAGILVACTTAYASDNCVDEIAQAGGFKHMVEIIGKAARTHIGTASAST